MPVQEANLLVAPVKPKAVAFEMPKLSWKTEADKLAWLEDKASLLDIQLVTYLKTTGEPFFLVKFGAEDVFLTGTNVALFSILHNLGCAVNAKRTVAFDATVLS